MMTGKYMLSPMSDSDSQPNKPARACDRCYQIKERCQWSTLSPSCVRCQRLGFTCTTDRPIRPAGRRPRRFKPLKYTVPALTTASTPNPPTTKTADACDHAISLLPFPGNDRIHIENKLIHFLLDSNQVGKLDSYVLTPGFQNEEHRWLVDSLKVSFPTLKDIYVACAGSLLQAFEGENETAASLRDVCLRHASVAVTKLRDLLVTNREDAITCLNLGIGLATFGYSALGANVSGICRYCLNLIKPIIETQPLSDTKTQSLLYCLVFFETMDCLATRQVPTIKVTVPFPAMVDRFIGLSYPLLPIFYDICLISNELAGYLPSQNIEISQRLDKIETAVIEWIPPVPSNFLGEFEPMDAVRILAQARIYRLLALLLIHRLRNSFGQNDREAEHWSQDIINELEFSNRLCNSIPVHCVTMPFLAAAVEVTEPATRVKMLELVDTYVDCYGPAVRKWATFYLRGIWQDRDRGQPTWWLNSDQKSSVGFASL